MERRDKYQRAAAQQHSAIQFEKQRRKHLATDKPEGAGWVVWFSVLGFAVSTLAVWKVVEIIIWFGNKLNF